MSSNFVILAVGPRQANLVLIAYLAAKVQASLCIRTGLPEPSLLAHTSSESRGTFRQKTRSLALLNGWACAVKICHDGMLEDTNSLDGAQLIIGKSHQRSTHSILRLLLKQREFHMLRHEILETKCM